MTCWRAFCQMINCTHVMSPAVSGSLCTLNQRLHSEVTHVCTVTAGGRKHKEQPDELKLNKNDVMKDLSRPIILLLNLITKTSTACSHPHVIFSLECFCCSMCHWLWNRKEHFSICCFLSLWGHFACCDYCAFSCHHFVSVCGRLSSLSHR